MDKWERKWPCEDVKRIWSAKGYPLLQKGSMRQVVVQWKWIEDKAKQENWREGKPMNVIENTVAAVL